MDLSEKNINKVCIIYVRELKINIAEQLFKYFETIEIPVRSFELSQDLAINQDEEQYLLNEIKSSDFIIPVLHPIQEQNKSYQLTRHIYEVIGRAETDDDKLVFPIYQHSLKLSKNANYLKPQQFFSNTGSYFWNDDLSDEENIETFAVQFKRYTEYKKQKKKELEAKKEEIIKTTEKGFTKPTKDDLIKREKRLRSTAVAWSIIGFVCLAVGVLIAASFAGGYLDQKENKNFEILLLLISKNILLIVLLIAAARYAFMFSKTYMNESLKNADRIHAIRFGEVYLKLFKKEIKYHEFKEVFESWNTKGDGTFMTIKSEDFDPKLLSKISELLKNIKITND